MVREHFSYVFRDIFFHRKIEHKPMLRIFWKDYMFHSSFVFNR